MTLLYNPDQNYLIPRLLRNTVCAVYLLTSGYILSMCLSRLHVKYLCNFDPVLILSYLFVMGADYLFALKIIEIRALEFFKHNNSFVATL